MNLRRCLQLVFILLLTGCAGQVQESGKRFFWPIGAAEPKIEYLSFYATDQDVRHPESELAQAILGIEPGVPIFASPRGIAAEGSRRFYVADNGKRKVLICDLDKGEVRSLLNDEGDAFFFPTPMGVALDASGGGYVSDTNTGTIFRFNAAEQVVSEFGKGELNRPNGMTFDPQRQRLYVADTANHSIAVFTATGKFLKRIGKRGQREGAFNYPLDVDLAPDGSLVVLDALNARVQVFSSAGEFIRAFGERGTALGSFRLPKSLAVDGFGHVYVTDSQAHRFVIFDLEGNYLLTIGGRAVLKGGVQPGGFDFPQGIDADKDGAIWIVDSLSRMVHRFQFLSEAYLEENPIRPGDAYLHQGLQ